MSKQLRVLTGIAAVAAAVALVVPLAAQQASAPPDAPTKQDPLRFSAFTVSMQSGRAGDVEIAIERWTTDDERKALLDVLAGASLRMGGQAKLLSALQKVEPRTGFIRTPNSLGLDLKYTRENMLSDGTRQIVIATDRPIGFLGAAGGDAVDHPFTIIEMRMKPNDKGEGRMLASTAVAIKNGRLEFENYAQEPLRLTTITQHQQKKKGT